MAKNPSADPENEEVPREFPEVTPTAYAETVGAAYLVESMMQMQKTLGELTANVGSLVKDVRSQGDKIDTLRGQASFIKGGLAVAVALLGAFGAIASYVLSTKWDDVTAALEALQAVVK